MAYKQHKSVFIVLEAGKSKIKAVADGVSGEDPLTISLMALFLLCPLVVERARELLGLLFQREQSHSRGLPRQDLIISQTPFPDTIILGVGSSVLTYEWENTNIQPITHVFYHDKNIFKNIVQPLNIISKEMF